MSDKKLYNAKELAKELGVHPNTIYSWRDKGLIKVSGKTPTGREFYSTEVVEKLRAQIFGEE